MAPLARTPPNVARCAVWRTSVGSTCAAGVGAEVVERLERLVREVDRVAPVDEHVVGDGREHHRFGVGEPVGFDERGLEHALGGVGRRGCRRSGGTSCASRSTGTPSVVERPDREARRAAARVARDEREAVHERERAVVAGRGGGCRFAIATSIVSPAPQPGVAVAGAELHAGAHDLAGLDARVEQPEHRLRDRRARCPPRGRRAGGAAGGRPHPARRAGARRRRRREISTSKPARVVGPQVERAARHEVEAGVVPVAGDEPGLDRALVEREPEVRAAVLDRVRARRRARTRRPAASRPSSGAGRTPAGRPECSGAESPLRHRVSSRYLRERILAIICLRDGSRQVRSPAHRAR